MKLGLHLNPSRKFIVSVVIMITLVVCCFLLLSHSNTAGWLVLGFSIVSLVFVVVLIQSEYRRTYNLSIYELPTDAIKKIHIGNLKNVNRMLMLTHAYFRLPYTTYFTASVYDTYHIKGNDMLPMYPKYPHITSYPDRVVAYMAPKGFKVIKQHLDPKKYLAAMDMKNTIIVDTYRNSHNVFVMPRMCFESYLAFVTTLSRIEKRQNATMTGGTVGNMYGIPFIGSYSLSLESEVYEDTTSGALSKWLKGKKVFDIQDKYDILDMKQLQRENEAEEKAEKAERRKETVKQSENVALPSNSFYAPEESDEEGDDDDEESESKRADENRKQQAEEYASMLVDKDISTGGNKYRDNPYLHLCSGAEDWDEIESPETAESQETSKNAANEPVVTTGRDSRVSRSDTNTRAKEDKGKVVRERPKEKEEAKPIDPRLQDLAEDQEAIQMLQRSIIQKKDAALIAKIHKKKKKTKIGMANDDFLLYVGDFGYKDLIPLMKQDKKHLLSILKKNIGYFPENNKYGFMWNNLYCKYMQKIPLLPLQGQNGLRMQQHTAPTNVVSKYTLK